MKQILYIIFLFGISTCGFSQIEFNSKFKPIPPANKTIKTTVLEKKETVPSNIIPPDDPIIVAPNIINKTNLLPTQPQTSSKYQIGKKESFSMEQKNDFANSGDQYVSKMEKDLDKTLRDQGLREGRGQLVRTNVSFGDFKTKSEYFVVRFRDFGAIDGDLVKVTSNDKIIRDEVFLESTYKEVKIMLEEGFNKIDFIALNIGTLGGNTAEIVIYDDHKNLIKHDYWDNLAAGIKASLIVVKEE